MKDATHHLSRKHKELSSYLHKSIYEYIKMKESLVHANQIEGIATEKRIHTSDY